MAIDVAKLTLEPGTRFGRYEVVTEIASGGMATVFLARSLGAGGFQRLVAIKLMHPHYAKDEEFVTMFMDEARLAARIRHPNVVATLDLQNDEDGLYLVMEYIEGEGLLGIFKAAKKTRTPLAAPIAVRIILDVLNGLQAAHELTGERGEPLKLVHRDISPHNVMVGVDGIARITDFGIARAEERLGATRDGQIKGKLAYMAPEQTSAKAVDGRADLFAAGVVLWEALAGRRLLAGQNDGEVLRNLLVNPIPRLKDVKPELGAALDEVCAKALERDPDLRYRSAAQFCEALEEAGGGIGIGSARAVARHVREVSGKSIAAMQLRVQGLLPPDASRERSGLRRKESTDPEHTVRRDEYSDPNLASAGSDPSLSQKLAPIAVAPSVPRGNSAPALDRRAGSDLQAAAAGARRQRHRGLFVALVAVGCVALGGALMTLFVHPHDGSRSRETLATVRPARVSALPTNPPSVIPAAAVEPIRAAQDRASAPVPTPEATPSEQATNPVQSPETITETVTEAVNRPGPRTRRRPAASVRRAPARAAPTPAPAAGGNRTVYQPEAI